MRREAVHKAQPVMNYHHMTIKQSDKPLTDPKSPNFSKLPSERRTNAM